LSEIQDVRREWCECYALWVHHDYLSAIADWATEERTTLYFWERSRSTSSSRSARDKTSKYLFVFSVLRIGINPSRESLRMACSMVPWQHPISSASRFRPGSVPRQRPPSVQRGKFVAERSERFFSNPRREEGANLDSQLTNNAGFGEKIRYSLFRETASSKTS